MGNIIAGLVLIAIGLFIGDSIFQGQLTITGIIFDGLGLFWIGKGVWGLVQARREGA